MTGILLGGSFLAGAFFGFLAGYIVLPLALLLVAVRKTTWWFAVVMVLLLAAGAFRAQGPASSPATDFATDQVAIEGTILSPPIPRANGQQFMVETDADSPGSRHVICVNAPAGPTVMMASNVRLIGTMSRTDDQRPAVAASYASRGCEGLFEAESLTILKQQNGIARWLIQAHQRINGAFQQAAPGDAGVLMSGLVTGDDTALSFAARAAFIRTGTSHITAVSGSNFGLIVLLVTVFSTGIGMRTRTWWIMLVVGLIWFYAWFVDFTPSALRAALMATLAVIALRFGRLPDLVTLAIVCGAFQVLIRPNDAASLAFQLSFVSTVALVLVFSHGNLKSHSPLISIVTLSIVAHLATIPILIHTFGTAAMLTVPANILIAPFVMVSFPLAMIAGGLALFWPTLGTAAAVPAVLPSRATLDIVTQLQDRFPDPMQTGSAGALTVALIALVCWLSIGLASSDARVGGSRLHYWWVRRKSESSTIVWGFGISVLLSAILVVLWSIARQ